MSEVIREEEVAKVESKRVEVTKETPRVLICVYGTLRTGQGNWRWCLENKAKCLGTFQSNPEFTMYGRRAGFPSLVPGGKTSIEYEVFEVTDNKTLNGLHSLEGCNGIPGHKDNKFYDIMPMSTPVGEGWIYVRPGFKADEESEIKTGNWLNRNPQ